MAIADLADELLKTKNIFNYFAGVVWELKGYEPSPGVISVSTYHKSKGLEWDIVFLTGLNNSDFPVDLTDKFVGEYWFLKEEYKNPKAISKLELKGLMCDNIKEDLIKESLKDSIIAAKMETIAEKARLLYVGITRAKKHLFMSGYHSNIGKKNESKPSKYLTVLKNFISRERLKWKKI